MATIQEAGRFKRQERQYLEHKLAKYMPQVQEVNLIAKELKKNVYFQIKLGHDVNASEVATDQLKIRVEGINKDYGYVYQWDTKKFSNRYFIMKDLLDNYFENNSIPQLS